MTVPWYQLVDSGMSPNDKYIIHIVQSGPVEDRLRYISVRAGVSFPSQDAPGAYVIIGRETDDKFETSPGACILLDEWEFSGLSIDKFWDKVTDAVVLHIASPVYFDIEDEPNLDAFMDYCSRNSLSIDYQEAPFADNFFTGLSTANDWLREGNLVLHKSSKTREQLKSITKDDLGNKPEQRFPLVNALRHCLSGFRKYPPTTPLKLRLGTETSPQAWMKY